MALRVQQPPPPGTVYLCHPCAVVAQERCSLQFVVFTTVAFADKLCEVCGAMSAGAFPPIVGSFLPGRKLIEVMYSCKGCALKEAKIDVPPRGEEDVVKWVEQTMLFCQQDHGERSPDCDTQHLDLKIPMAKGTDRVGGFPLQ